MADKPTIQPANDIPDLMTWQDYDELEIKKRVRVRLRLTERGLEIIADGPYPQQLEDLLARLDPHEIESRLCG